MRTIDAPDIDELAKDVMKYLKPKAKGRWQIVLLKRTIGLLMIIPLVTVGIGWMLTQLCYFLTVGLTVAAGLPACVLDDFTNLLEDKHGNS